jgi:hypothetical protein
MKKLLFLLFIVGIFQSAFAYPISPRPLRKLISESENIVIAYVLKSETMPAAKNHWESTRAVLVVREVLQGKIKEDTIYVYYSPGMICPAPATYMDGTTVIAFLDKQKKGDGYTTHSLSYGSKTLEEKGLLLYKERIKEMQAIQKIRTEEEKTEKTIEWLITCASYSETRWEGIYELSPESDFMSFYDQDRDTFTRKYALTKNQKERLRKIFFSIDYLDYNDLGLIDLVKKRNDPELVSFLIEKFKELKKEDLWYADMFMERIATYSDREELFEIIENIQQLDYMDSDYNEKKMQLTSEFLKRI